MGGFEREEKARNDPAFLFAAPLMASAELTGAE